MQGVSQDLYKVDVGNAEIVCKADELKKIREIPKLENFARWHNNLNNRGILY